MPAKRNDIDVDYLIREYLTGKSEYALANELHVARLVIRRILNESHIPIRDRSEAGKVRASRMTAEDRERQAAAAHVAAKGRVKTFEEQCMAARTRERIGLIKSPYESILREMLLARGIETIPQVAVGPYNCDLGAAPIAVEIFGGGWHRYGTHLRIIEKRFRYVLHAGWFILALFVDRYSPLDDATADYIASYIQRIRSDPPARREYRVIWRAGQFFTAGSAEDDKISIEPPFTYRHNPTNGRYETITR